MSKSKVTSHILDTEIGRPADGVKITLEALIEDHWSKVGEGETDHDGRVVNWIDQDIKEGDTRYLLRWRRTLSVMAEKVSTHTFQLSFISIILMNIIMCHYYLMPTGIQHTEDHKI